MSDVFQFCNIETVNEVGIKEITTFHVQCLHCFFDIHFRLAIILMVSVYNQRDGNMCLFLTLSVQHDDFFWPFRIINL